VQEIINKPSLKNMVLTRTVKSNNPAKLASTTTSTSASGGMISFETRGSTSFESREKKFASKYSNKSRTSHDEFIMLQRPTPIILAKPALKVNLIRPKSLKLLP